MSQWCIGKATTPCEVKIEARLRTIWAVGGTSLPFLYSLQEGPLASICGGTDVVNLYEKH